MTTVVIDVLLFFAFLTMTALSQKNDSLSVLAPRLTEFKMNLHRMLEGSRIRKRRQLRDPYGSAGKQMRFGSSAPEDLPYLSGYKLTFWIPVQHPTHTQVLVGTQGGHLILFQLSEDNLATIVARSEAEEVATKAKAFFHYDDQWFAVLKSAGEKTWIRLYERIGRGLERRQEIRLDAESDFDLITVKGIHYLAAVTFRSKTSHGFSYESTVTLYHWVQTQFDTVASRPSYGGRSVVCWVLDGSLYFAVAQERNNEGNLAVGSPIYLYNAKEENQLMLLGKLMTHEPKKVVHFYVAGSHYLIFIGNQDAVLYWWSYDQFLAWQTIERTAGASDVSVLTLSNGEVAIAIALMEEVLFLTLDASGYYVVSFTMSFTGFSFASLQFLFTGKAYYALALFEATLEQPPHPIWKLTLTPSDMPTAASLDELQQCMQVVGELLDERRTELKSISSDIDRVWLTNKNQSVSADVIVIGGVNSAAITQVTQVLILTDHMIPEASSILPVVTRLTEQLDLVDGIQGNLASVVYKTTRQDIAGVKHFEEVFIPSLNMASSDADIAINGVPVSRLAKHALRKFGDQHFQVPTVVSGLRTTKATVGALNGLSTEDLLLLHGKQVISGKLAFAGVQSSELSTGNVNSVPVTDLVTTHSDQTILDLKLISALHALVITVRGQTNGEDLSAIRENIVTLDSDEIQGKLFLEADVRIRGNIFATGLINGIIDIAEMIANGVTKDTQQDLTGSLFFTENQVIGGDFQVKGLVNNLETNQLLTWADEQVISGDITFIGPLTINQDLTVDSINGFSFDEDVVLKFAPSQFITGLKNFSNDMQVDFIDMTEFVTLDGVDPSLFIQDIVMHKEGVVKHDSTVFRDVIVTGDVKAIGGVNGYDILDLPQIVWLNSVPQEIDVAVNVEKIITKSAVHVKSVTGLNLDKDIAHSFGNEIVISVSKFEHKISVMKYFNITEGTHVNGMDISSLDVEMGNYNKDDWTISGVKILKSVEVEGDMTIEGLNGLKTSDLMLEYPFQRVLGDVQFSSELVSFPGNLDTRSISFNYVNSMNINDFFNNAVLSNRPNSWTIKHKTFSRLEASHLSLGKGSKLGGISLDEMERRVATLNTPQIIDASKSFDSPLDFSKPVVAGKMNGLEISSFANNIVLLDEASVISKKVFMGNIAVNDIFVQGLVNGIRIEEMLKGVFMKSTDNEVTAPFTIKNDIDVGNLVSLSIDGVNWEDLIFLGDDEILGSAWFLSNTLVLGHVFITGKLNECDISQIRAGAIYSNKTKQVISGEINIETLEVIGNVKIKNTLSQIAVDDFKRFISTSGDQVVESSVVIESGILVENLHLGQTAENIDLSFIVKDAVRHSASQVITGRKDFAADFLVEQFTGGDLFLRGRLNGIDMEELDKTAVWKTGHQIIKGEKSFTSLNTDIATVEGYLNGLSIPKDVVMTDTSEHITSPVFFMSNLFLEDELMVHGKIDGTDLDSLVKNLVSLSDDQNLTSALVFKKDFILYDKMIIDGTINDLVLEMVAKRKGKTPLGGYKMFMGIEVFGLVVVPAVNGHDVTKLGGNILSYKNEEFINEFQVFPKSLRVQNSLSTEWINNVSLTQISSTFSSVTSGLRAMLGYFEDLTATIRQQMNRQLMATGDEISRFAYFLLIQEIDLGPASKILYGSRLESSTSEFSHSMVIWISKKQCSYMERCCYLEFTYWMRVKKTGHLMVDGDADIGRYYPIHNPAPVTTDKDFFIWTNSSQMQPKWCGKGYEKMFFASLTEDYDQEIFMDIKNSPLLSDIKSFRQGHLYSVAAFFYDKIENEHGNTVVYLFSELRREWTEYQILPSFGVLSLDITDHVADNEKEILLALGTGMGTRPHSYSSVYKWSYAERKFEIFQNIPSQYVTSTLWIKRGPTLMLAMAGVEHWPGKSDCSELISGGQVDIHVYEAKLKWIQSIPLAGVVAMVSFSVKGDTFLVAASIQLQTVYVYQWKGYSGFIQIQSLFAGEVKHLSIYRIGGDIYLAMAIQSGPSKILKIVFTGNYAMPVSNKREIGYEQKDEATKEEKFVSGC